MDKKRIVSAIMSAAAAASLLSLNAYAEDTARDTVEEGTSSEAASEVPTEENTVLHKVTFVDFDGNPMQTLEVADGEKIDYSKINTDILHRHTDAFTEEKFSKWSITPETTDKDITVEALYSRAKLTFDSQPQRVKYFDNTGDISTAGMKVSVTTETQLAEKDETGHYILEGTKVDITPSCTITPVKLQDVFKDGNISGNITVYASGESKPVASFKIFLLDLPGDMNRSGKMEADDASLVLRKFVELSENENALGDEVVVSTGSDGVKKLSADEFIAYADVNCDRKISADDASLILRYYSMVSSNPESKWSELADIK